jgi:23S rRNA (guanosine2251-2'-O)-methyltransferase
MNNSSDSQDSAEYLQKKAFVRQLLTIFGRKPVLEVLQDAALPCYRLHLAESNKPSGIVKDIIDLAQQRKIDIHYHDRQALARISKNGKQDQGVCLDIHCPTHQSYQQFLEHYFKAKSEKKHAPTAIRLLALDSITNPQNLGMIIRSACAGNIDGLLIPDKGCAKLDALVIKASAGTLFKAPLLRCENLEKTLQDCQQAGAKVIGLSGQAKQTLADFDETDFVIYVLGNETDGISKPIEQGCDQLVYIPMNNQVESLNVAVTASLLAFRQLL